MGLKNEIKKLIDQKKSKLEKQKGDYLAHEESQKSRIESIVPLINEVCESVELDCLDVHHRGNSIDIDLGLLDNGRRVVDLSWSIEPAFGVGGGWPEKEESEGDSETVFYELDGFDVWEKIRSRDLSEESLRKSISFDSEESLIEYLIESITTYIAEYQAKLS